MIINTRNIASYCYIKLNGEEKYDVTSDWYKHLLYTEGIF